MTQTVYGVLCDALGHSSATELIQGRTGPELRSRTWSTPASAVSREQGRIFVDREHNPNDVVGEVVHLELDAVSGALWCVAHVHDDVTPSVPVKVGVEVRSVATPLYFSGERVGGVDIGFRFLSVALTSRTARIGARPCVFVDGSAYMAARTTANWHDRQLLERAAETHYRRHRHPGLTVHRQTADDHLEHRTTDRYMTVDGERLEVEIRPAQILSVNGEPCRSAS